MTSSQVPASQDIATEQWRRPSPIQVRITSIQLIHYEKYFLIVVEIIRALAWIASLQWFVIALD